MKKTLIILSIVMFMIPAHVQAQSPTSSDENSGLVEEIIKRMFEIFKGTERDESSQEILIDNNDDEEEDDDDDDQDAPEYENEDQDHDDEDESENENASSSENTDIKNGYPPKKESSKKGKGTHLGGSFWNTYYYFSQEKDYQGSKTTIYKQNCSEKFAPVFLSFAKDVCIQGSGIILSGNVIHFAGTCGCGPGCLTGSPVCYNILDKKIYPWGKGANGKPTIPLRTLAVDRTLIQLGTIIYIPEWDGIKIPKTSTLGDFTHDGCFVAGDVGGWIKGNHYDFFAGTKAMYQKLNKIKPTHSTFSFYINPERCSHYKSYF